MEQMKVELTYHKSTKGTHVYQTAEPDAPVTSLYIKRIAFPPDAPTPPDAIWVTINPRRV